MGENSAIEWTHHTFNPWEGCVHDSPACDFCYAETRAHRFHHDVWGPGTPRLMRRDAYWREPLKWDREAAAAGERRRVFCASLADVFEDHPDVPEARARLWELIAATPNLDWLLLTKRPQNVLDMVPEVWHTNVITAGPTVHLAAWPENVWIGSTVENQRYLNVRMRWLSRIPAPVRFLSMEPLLGAVDLTEWIDSIDWVIVGGEANHKDSRPMSPHWVRSIIRQCEAHTIACPNDTNGDGDCATCARPSPFAPERGRHVAPVPVLFKQWGDWTSTVPALVVRSDDVDLWLCDDGRTTTSEGFALTDEGDWVGMFRLGKKNTGRVFEGTTFTQYPTPRHGRTLTPA